jgi:glycine betaine/proline transport system substrate-binding protein
MTNQRKLVLALTIVAATLASCGKKEEAQVEEKAVETAEATCGNVTIANMNWQSAEVIASIDKFVLSKGYGCDAELVPGDTMPTLTAMMEKGQPDVAPEAWINSVREPLKLATDEGRLHVAAEVLSDGGVEGWWIPKYIAEANPNIKTIADALNHPELFPAPEDKTKGAVYNCPAGWSCQISTGHAFTAWGAADKGFTLVDTGSSAGLDGSIAKAYERKEGWLGYYWAPTSILGKYEMVRLDPGVELDQAAWDTCNSVVDCADPKMNRWPRSDVFSVVTDRFKQAGGKAYEYLATRQLDNDSLGKLLSWMTDNQATGEAAAEYYLKNNEATWTTWVSPAAAEKIKAAL